MARSSRGSRRLGNLHPQTPTHLHPQTPSPPGRRRGTGSGGASGRAGLDPYGVDPVFLPRSKLYDAQLAAQGGAAQLYYNTSPAAGEVAATGTPYGFFARAGLKVWYYYLRGVCVLSV